VERSNKLSESAFVGYFKYRTKNARYKGKNKMKQSITKRRYIKFQRQGITQKKEYNIQNRAKVLNQEQLYLLLKF
jgi:hypothetical protein